MCALHLRGKSNYQPHPEGQFAARCIDVVDLPNTETSFGTKHCLRLVFTTDCDEDGRAWRISRRFTASIHPQSSLHAFVVGWRGRKFTDAELKGAFDADALVGQTALLTVTHTERDGETFDQLVSAVKLPKGMSAPPWPEKYVRVQDRDPVAVAQRQAAEELERFETEDTQALAQARADHLPPPQSEGSEDDDLPF